MALIKNAINFGNGFNIGAVGPIDSRMRVQYLSDLTTAWSDTIPSYIGMVVTVMYDETKPIKGEGSEEIIGYEPLGQVYVLKSTNASDLTNWVKLSTAADSEASADDVQENLNQEISARTEADKQIYSAITSAKTELSDSIASAKTEFNDAIASAKTELSDSIASAKTELNDSIASAKTELSGAIASAKTELSGAIASAKTELSDSIASAKTELMGEIEAVSGDVVDLESKVDGHISATTEALNALKIKDVTSGDKVLSVDTDGKLSSELSIDYNSTDKKIHLKGISGTVISTIDAADFIKDGMLNKAELVTSGGKTELVFSFNTDGGTDTVNVDVTSLLNGTELQNLQLALDTHIASANTQHFRAEERAKFEALINNYDADTLSSKFNTIETTLTSHTKSISDLESNVTTISGDVKTLSETVNTNHSAFTAHVESYETKVKDIEDSISALTTANTAAHEALQNEIASAKTEFSDSIASAKTELNDSIASAKTELSDSIASAKTELNDSIASAKTELSGAIDTAKSELSGAIDTAKSELNSAIASANTKIDEVSALTTANKTEIEKLNQKVTENEEIIANSLTDLQKNKVSSISVAENSNISIVENKTDNGISYQIDFTWLEF